MTTITCADAIRDGMAVFSDVRREHP